MHSLMRRAWVEIDLGALSHNAATIAERAGVPLMPLVKADAYGLGAVRVARVLDRQDPWGFGVASIAEGEELRAAGITRPILVVSPLMLEDLDAAQRSRLTPTLATAREIHRWRPTGRPWHLQIDTGMSRAGVRWNALDAVAEAVRATPPEGIFTHFHSAELLDDSRDVQERRFEEALATLGVTPELLHTENSPAVEHRGPSRWSFVRPGVFLYGVSTAERSEIQPMPVVSIRARVVSLRTIEAGDTVSYDASWTAPSRRRIATLPVGYADGYRRSLGNRGTVLVHGHRAPVVGNVTMDMTMIDVTEVPCELGDAVTLVGTDGDASIGISDLAAASGLSPYEILTGLRGRLPRRYLGDG